jgi:subtilisin family serine protease
MQAAKSEVENYRLAKESTAANVQIDPAKFRAIFHIQPHFQKYANIDPAPGWHKDFTVDGAGPFDDQNSHGTHVAGIIAGEWRVPADAPKEIRRPLAVSRY